MAHSKKMRVNMGRWKPDLCLIVRFCSFGNKARYSRVPLSSINLGPECLCVLAIGPVCASAGIF